MKLKELQKNWDEMGKIDAFGNILTDPAKKGKWDRDEFFQNGEEEISSVMRYIESLKMRFSRSRALDFGCGVGRLTQALCHYFEECSGVDIAPSMIELANKYNQHVNKCRYYLNESDDLKLFKDNHFDFVYSNIVLQHIKPEYSKRYIKEFLRILAPGGLIIFQLPSERVAHSARLTPDDSMITQKLPDSAFRAQITMINPFSTMKVSSQTILQVKLTNISQTPWPATGDMNGKYKMNLGNHWLNQSGNILVNDDGRAGLPKDLDPMEEVDLSLPVTAPQKPGVYFLELDMVQEGVSWFKDKGSQTARLTVNVHPLLPLRLNFSGKLINRIQPGVRSKTFSPRMEMHGVKKTEIFELIESNGGRIVDIQEFNVSGEQWLSFKYCVTK